MGNGGSKVAGGEEEDGNGGDSSVSRHKASVVQRSTAEVVKLMFPVYYVEERISPDELCLAKTKWNMILSNTSEYFLSMQGKPGFEQPTCISLFYDCFYARLFDVHPLSKPMFSAGLKVQGKFLVKMMSLTLNIADQDAKFDETMVRLAEVHNDRGVKAIEYGVVGEVLFYTLRRCLGPEYDSRTHRAWVKLFSRMLSVIVPCAVQFEMRSGTSQATRLAASTKRSEKKKMFEFDENEGGGGGHGGGGGGGDSPSRSHAASTDSHSFASSFPFFGSKHTA